MHASQRLMVNKSQMTVLVSLTKVPEPSRASTTGFLKKWNRNTSSSPFADISADNASTKTSRSPAGALAYELLSWRALRCTHISQMQ